MTLKDKMKTYNFWISLVSAVLLLVRIIGDNYGFDVDAGLVMDITTGVCGIFVILGIISVPQKMENGKIIDNLKDETAMQINSNKVNNYNDLFIKMNEKMQISSENIENAYQNNENLDKVVNNDEENEALLTMCNETDQNVIEIIEDNNEDVLIQNETDEITQCVVNVEKLNEFIDSLSDIERDNLKNML